MHLFIYLLFFYFLFQKNSSFSNMFCNENNLKKLLYFCLIRYRFEVWKKKTNLFFFFKYGFFPLSFAVYFVFYFLSSIFKFSFKIIFSFFVSCLNIFILYVLIFFIFLSVLKKSSFFPLKKYICFVFFFVTTLFHFIYLLTTCFSFFNLKFLVLI
jgi:hypothetical protein